MSALEHFRLKLKNGSVYRRQDLRPLSPSADLHLQALLSKGFIEKLSGGLYYVPTQSIFGKTPPEEDELIRTFLKGGIEFLLVDLVNHIELLAEEDPVVILQRLKMKVLEMDQTDLKFLIGHYASLNSKKIFKEILRKLNGPHPAP